ncbi:uncharacterized protein LOC103829342 isoform X1 [Brassica rapa]|uniref:Uncharacterized protein n=1 Tax=Brassica campestris TaxID=3711 RepID=M4D755_BRACM|nr:uncharacterized protein LOC103829342 isoform X1 [Brassica rapa]
MIRGGGGKSSGYSADLMGCFPSRTRLSLHSKSIFSPSHSFIRRENAPHHRRSFSKLSGSGGSLHNSQREVAEEPTSPQVTCAGQIKVRSSKRSGGGKNWQSLAEIKKIHRTKSEGKFLGIKKDIMGFLTCLRDLDFRCFGAFPPVDAVSHEEEDEDEDEASGSVFSKWSKVLHEKKKAFTDAETAVPRLPPPNALLLMRCRSARADNECENTEKDRGEDEKETVIKKKDLRTLMEKEKNVNMVVMNYDTNCYKLSPDISKETWVVGGTQDLLLRSQSWKR